MADLAPIADDLEHAMLLAELQALLEKHVDPAPDSEPGQRIQELVAVIEPYEKMRWPLTRRE